MHKFCCFFSNLFWENFNDVCIYFNWYLEKTICECYQRHLIPAIKWVLFHVQDGDRRRVESHRAWKQLSVIQSTCSPFFVNILLILKVKQRNSSWRWHWHWHHSCWHTHIYVRTCRVSWLWSDFLSNLSKQSFLANA